jgi:VWFA-related protein
MALPGANIYMNTQRLALIWLCGVSLSPAIAQPKQSPPQPASPVSGNRRIALDVVVTDKSGKPVPGIGQSDFTLLDNKRPQKIAAFRAVENGDKTDPPAQTIILLDDLNASRANVAIQRDQVEAFFKKNAGALPGPVFVALFSISGVEVANSARSPEAAALEMALNRGRDGQLMTAEHLEAYGHVGEQQLSLYTLERLANYEVARPGRKLVIWISPGWPMANPEEGLSPKAQRELFGTIVALSDKLRRARITLYAADPYGLHDLDAFENSSYERFAGGAKRPGQVEMGDLGLQVLATQSGGLVLNGSNDVTGEIGRAVADAGAYYVLEFEEPPADGPNERHSLEIRIGRSGLKARARTVYYAQP